MLLLREVQMIETWEPSRTYAVSEIGETWEPSRSYALSEIGKH